MWPHTSRGQSSRLDFMPVLFYHMLEIGVSDVDVLGASVTGREEASSSQTPMSLKTSLQFPKWSIDLRRALNSSHWRGP